jgi:hypothetical protein
MRPPGAPVAAPDSSLALDALLARPPVRLDPAAFDAAGWERLVEDAWRHGLLAPLVARLPPDAAGLPPEVRNRLRRLVAGLRLAAGPLRSTEAEVLAALAAAGIPAVALKGRSLAERLYPDPDLRPSTDVDVLVPAADLDRAAEALAARGFRLDGSGHLDYQRRHHRHVSLLREGTPPVELHHRASTGFSMVVEAEPLLARARPGPRGLVLAPEDELLFLALHAADHGLERLGWLEDLLALLERAGPLDWESVSARARAAGAAAPAAFVLTRLARLGAPVPAAVLAPLGARRERIAEALRRRAVGAKRGRGRYTCLIAYQTVLAAGPWRALRRIAHEAEWFVRRRTRAYLRQRPRA